MNKLICIISLFVITALNFTAQAQSWPDGVKGKKTFVDEIILNYNAEKNIPFDIDQPSLSVKIPIRLHIIKNIDGLDNADPSQVYNSLEKANTLFKTIGISFFIDSVNYIPDYNYAFITEGILFTEMLTLYATAGKINLFLADSVRMDSVRTYGYTYFPTAIDSNYIFLDKKFINGNYLSTMLGHFMGLLSTHDKRGGMEMANEQNCAQSGDFICDTYADPNLYAKVDDKCIYNGYSTDPSGAYFVPSVANVMADSPDNCKCKFSPQQYRRMYFYYLRYRKN